MNQQDSMLWSQESVFYDGDFDAATLDPSSAFYAGGAAFGDTETAWYNQLFSAGRDLIGDWLRYDAQTELVQKQGEYELERARQQALIAGVQTPSSNTGEVPVNYIDPSKAQGNNLILIGVIAVATALLG